MTPRSSVVAVLFLLLAIVNSRALQSGPTAQECRHHIEAAIKEFLEGQSEKTETTTQSYEPYTRTQIEDAYATAESTGDEDQPTNIPDDQHETEGDNDEEEQHIDSAETDHVEDEDPHEREARNADEDDGDHSEDDEDTKTSLEEQPSETEEDTPKEPEPEHTEDTDEDDGADDRVTEAAEDTEHQQTGEEEEDEADEEDQEEGAVAEQDQEEAAEETGDDDQETDIHIDGEQADESDEDETSQIAEGTAETPEVEEDNDGGDSEEQPEDQVEAPPAEEEEHTKGEPDSTEQDEPTVSTDSDTPSTSDDETEEDKSHEDRVKRSEVVEGDDTESEIPVDEDKTEQDEPEDDSQVTAETRTETDDELTTDDQSKDHNETTEETGTEAGKEEEGEAEEEPIVQGPGELRTRENIEAILALEEDQNKDQREKLGNDVLKEIKRLYENAVRPLEQLYKFKDISTRQMGDAEIFSKPMVLFMGPWSTGKSAIINYLLGTEYTRHALKTGAEPTSNSFTVIMHGDTDQVIDGTQLAADWAFSTLQKFGQTFLDHLRGRRMPNPLLNKITIVDTPGILENRKSIERQYPFNDAFQWFIDRADLIYIVFDPTKLDIGLELEALFDQLKGRENQIRILLNKADTVKPQELMKVQGTLLWNLSPLLGTSEAPTVFVGSLWSRPYLPGSPTTLLDAQEQAFLEDLGETLENRIENKIAQARRHAVRVRNHAKMVDCYLSTYYNHKSFFSNKRKVADDIIDNPQNYQIYEGLSIMTNVSRYDLPDPDIYREFFRIHPLFDFKPLASTCSYFKGCPLDKLDIAIAYDLPELVGKYHRMIGNHPVVGGR